MQDKIRKQIEKIVKEAKVDAHHREDGKIHVSMELKPVLDKLEALIAKALRQQRKEFEKIIPKEVEYDEETINFHLEVKDMDQAISAAVAHNLKKQYIDGKNEMRREILEKLKELEDR